MQYGEHTQSLDNKTLDPDCKCKLTRDNIVSIILTTNLSHARKTRLLQHFEKRTARVAYDSTKVPNHTKYKLNKAPPQSLVAGIKQLKGNSR